MHSLNMGNRLQGYNISRCVANNAYLFRIITKVSFPTLQLYAVRVIVDVAVVAFFPSFAHK